MDVEKKRECRLDTSGGFNIETKRSLTAVCVSGSLSAWIYRARHRNFLAHAKPSISVYWANTPSCPDALSARCGLYLKIGHVQHATVVASSRRARHRERPDPRPVNPAGRSASATGCNKRYFLSAGRPADRSAPRQSLRAIATKLIRSQSARCGTMLPDCVITALENTKLSTFCALEVTPCQKVLRIDKLQSVKEITFYRQ
ncbi:PREDICTED: uncharacterized protein LOC106742143 [Dinoponera quadriceps]|uniref:Uncharacterized protein LOC106742143 n=1 Tax=Dinoponera quadriceps TaxID=609295 RepID=A0A6P3WVX1_DINQU|nr:PREDICTED: uncharacterized protein LOC106742143 [Dinoponera quadriceps]